MGVQMFAGKYYKVRTYDITLHSPHIILIISILFNQKDLLLLKQKKTQQIIYMSQILRYIHMQ